MARRACEYRPPLGSSALLGQWVAGATLAGRFGPLSEPPRLRASQGTVLAQIGVQPLTHDGKRSL